MKPLSIFVVLAMFGCGGSSDAADPEPAPSQDTATTSGTEDTAAEPAATEPAAEDEALVRADFEHLCSAAGPAAESTGNDPSQRRTAYAMAVASTLQTEAAREAFRAAGAVDARYRESVLSQAAADNGIEDWECPDLERIYGRQSPYRWE